MVNVFQENPQAGNAMLQIVLDSIQEKIILVDIQGRVIITNRTASQPSETYPKQSKGNTVYWWDEIYPPAKRNGAHTQEMKNISHDGLLYYSRLTIQPLLDKNGVKLGYFSKEENLTDFEVLEKKKIEFISITSHQLRTPLGSMRWNLEMLLASEFGKVPKGIRDIIDQIYHSDLRMIDLVNDLLSVSRIDQGRVFDQPKPTDITDLIKSVAAEVQTEAQKRSIVGKLHFGKEPIPKIMIDAKRLTEVIYNLFTNAIKYNKTGGRVTVKVGKKDSFIQIIISDEGIGIPQSNTKNIFSKYFRADNAVHATNNGTGLGLYIVKSYVEGWGGSITFQSKLNEGTTFNLEIPLKPKGIENKVSQNKNI